MSNAMSSRKDWRLRHFNPKRQLYHRWRPTSQNLALTRQLDGYCQFCPTRWFRWDHQIVHHPHGSNIRHAYSMCFFYYHRLPGEVWLLTLLARMGQMVRRLGKTERSRVGPGFESRMVHRVSAA